MSQHNYFDKYSKYSIAGIVHGAFAIEGLDVEKVGIDSIDDETRIIVTVPTDFEHSAFSSVVNKSADVRREKNLVTFFLWNLRPDIREDTAILFNLAKAIPCMPVIVKEDGRTVSADVVFEGTYSATDLGKILRTKPADMGIASRSQANKNAVIPIRSLRLAAFGNFPRPALELK